MCLRISVSDTLEFGFGLYCYIGLVWLAIVESYGASWEWAFTFFREEEC